MIFAILYEVMSNWFRKCATYRVETFNDFESVAKSERGAESVLPAYVGIPYYLRIIKACKACVACKQSNQWQILLLWGTLLVWEENISCEMQESHRDKSAPPQRCYRFHPEEPSGITCSSHFFNSMGNNTPPGQVWDGIRISCFPPIWM